MGADNFDEMVEEAWNGLPETFREKLQNVEVVVEELADANTLQLAQIHNPMNLLGFYHGVPLTKRGTGYHMTTPDKISLYRRPITYGCHNNDELRTLIAHVLRHEIAHHFGISDARLHEIGAYSVLAFAGLGHRMMTRGATPAMGIVLVMARASPTFAGAPPFPFTSGSK